ncbi:hypothetical protein OG21DRAFT_1483841 [Imleria badia]|nr:hypothetical protein OG21DRAFT_1483841 [Imleria badia]
MRFSFFAFLSGLAALAVGNALPAENLERGAPSDDMCECIRLCPLPLKPAGCCECVPEDP